MEKNAIYNPIVKCPLCGDTKILESYDIKIEEKYYSRKGNYILDKLKLEIDLKAETNKITNILHQCKNGCIGYCTVVGVKKKERR